MTARRPVVRINRPLPPGAGPVSCQAPQAAAGGRRPQEWEAPQAAEGGRRPQGWDAPRAGEVGRRPQGWDAPQAAEVGRRPDEWGPAREAGAGRRSRTAGLRIGLLGGSFNPAHGGHRAVSLEALRRLRLDRVLWLVSPQNPLKPSRGMAPFEERFASARAVARHPRVLVSDLEQRAGMRFTLDTIRHLQRDRRNRYVWLIGADNMIQLPQWKGWREIVRRVPIAVFDREPYVYRALAGEVAHRYAAARLPEAAAAGLADAEPPAWAYVRFRRHPVSSTALRRRQAEDEEEAAF